MLRNKEFRTRVFDICDLVATIDALGVCFGQLGYSVVSKSYALDKASALVIDRGCRKNIVGNSIDIISIIDESAICDA